MDELIRTIGDTIVAALNDPNTTDIVKTLKNQIRDLNADKERLAKEAAQACAANLALRSENAALREQNKSLADANSVYVSEIKSYDKLKSQLADKDRTIASLRAAGDHLTQVNNSLRGQLPTTSFNDLQCAYNKLVKQYKAACSQRDEYLYRLEHQPKTKTPVVPHDVGVLNVDGVMYTREDVAKLRDHNLKLIDEAQRNTVPHLYVGSRPYTVEDVKRLIKENVDGKIIIADKTAAANRAASEIGELKMGNKELAAKLKATKEALDKLTKDYSQLKFEHEKLVISYNELKGQHLIRIHNPKAEIQIDGTNHRFSVAEIVRFMGTEVPHEAVACNITNGDMTVCYEDVSFPARVIPKMWACWQDHEVYHRVLVDGKYYDLDKIKLTYCPTVIGDIPCDETGIKRLDTQLRAALAANKKALDGILAATEKLHNAIS